MVLAAAAPALLAGMKYLPLGLAAAAGVPKLLEGKPLEALGSAGLAYAGGRLVGKGVANPAVYGATIPGTGKTAIGFAGMAGQKLGLSPSQMLGLGAATTAGLAIPSVAQAITSGVGRAVRNVAAPVANPAQAAAQTALGYGAYRQTPADYGANLPYAYDQSIDQYGGITPSGTPGDVLGPMGLGRSLEAQRQAQAQAEALRILKPIEMGYIDAMRRRDFARQAAMKGIAQNIETSANMLQNAQVASMNLGQTTGEGISRALGQVTQYQ